MFGIKRSKFKEVIIIIIMQFNNYNNYVYNVNNKSMWHKE